MKLCALSFSRFAGALLLCCAAPTACGGDEASDKGSASNAQPLRCTPNEPRPCPCRGATDMGTQMCEATGNGYGACMGCPAAAVAGSAGSAGSAGTSAGTAGTSAGSAGASAGNAGTSGGAGASGEGGASGSAGTDAGSDSDGGEPLPAADVEPGASCGVGLIVQCAPDTEKCCARSLEADTCIEASAECSCGLDGCTTLQVYCDGPEDCADGEVCCGTLAGGTSYTEFACAATCDSLGQQRVACHQQDPECESGLECANSQLLTNIQICIDPATIQQ